MVEGAYILRLTVTNENPELAVRSVNIHSERYSEIASREFQSETSRAADLVRERIAARGADLQALFDQRRQSELLMLTLRETGLQLNDNRMQRRIQQAKLEELVGQSGSSDRGPARNIAEELESLEQQITFRTEQIAELPERLSVLSSREAALLRAR